jgi:thiamine biosynthesis lipoprotein
MGTAISLDIADPLPAAELSRLTDDTFGWLRTVDARFSTYRSDSEVSRVDRGELAADDCGPDMRHVLDECARLWKFTNGFFDAYASGRFDPSGYVKGWSVQVASDRLVARGAANHCLNAGGDICARGRHASGRPWRIGVLHPERPADLAWTLELTDTAVATSGTYERGNHVVNPFTGAGATELRSVSVVGADLALADAYATAAMAMGRAGIDWLAALPGHRAAVITANGGTYRSPDLPCRADMDQETPG